MLLMPPVQWLLDAVTAAALFVVLGFRWPLLPALAVEVVPALQLFPTWTLVVAAMASTETEKVPTVPPADHDERHVLQYPRQPLRVVLDVHGRGADAGVPRELRARLQSTPRRTAGHSPARTQPSARQIIVWGFLARGRRRPWPGRPGRLSGGLWGNEAGRPGSGGRARGRAPIEALSNRPDTPMLSLKQFLNGLDGDAATDGDDEVVRAEVFGLDVAAVMLPSELLAEDRVSRMNALWDLLGEREALVIAPEAKIVKRWTSAFRFSNRFRL